MSTLASVRNFLRLVRSHPLTRENNWTTFVRLLRWQLASRLLAYPVVVPWVDDCRLVIKRGMVGASGNHYFGLHEFEDMGFLLHFLREDDLWGDERPVMIRMDVEGFETEALRGGEGGLGAPQLLALLIELKSYGACYGFDENALRDRFESWGLYLSGYDPIMRKLQPQARSCVALQSNSHYVRDVQDAQARLSASAPFHVVGRLI
jgi:hypothetical protein